MIQDYTLPKPPTETGYSLHRITAGLLAGEKALYRDCGDRILIRTTSHIGNVASPVEQPKTGDVRVFQLRASVSKKTHGKRSYFATADWRSRHAWLARQGERHGFELLTVNCNADIATVEKTGQKFTVDCTDFAGALKVIDEDKFALALQNGVGGTGRAFGFGMLII
jgi:CRISPR associated protein